MALRFTCAVPDTEDLQEACGLPLGLVAQPLARDGSGSTAAPCWASDLARCARCLAYINSLCDVDDHGWACSLCGCGNDFSSASSLRRYYDAGSGRRAALPELRPGPLDCLCPLVAADPDEGTEEVLALAAQPAVLALVDVCCGEEELELVKSALAAAVEGLPPAARFGLVSFGSQVGLHTLGPGGKPLVAHVTLEGDEGLQADLAEAVPLNDVLAQVGASKAAMLAAIEGLEPEPPVGGGVERYLGAALRAVLRWVATGAAEAAEAGLDQQQQHAAGGISHGGAAVEAPMQQQWQAEEAQQAAQQEPQEGAAGSPAGPTLPPASGFPGMRLLVFLSGPPNCGAGAVVSRRPPPLSPQAAAAAAQLAKEAAKDVAFLVLDPVYPELSSWSGESEIQQGAREQQAAAAEAAAAAAAAAGDLSHAVPPGVPAEELTVDLAAAQFYGEAGAAAAALGVSVDVFACAGPRWTGLELVEPLAAASGGTALLYTHLEAAALPQDVYKAVAAPRAFACLLRLRCSPELEVEDAHGRLVADREHEDLWRLVACGPEDAFAFDLQRSSRRAACAAPAVQLVLQYSLLVPGAGSPQGSRFELRRFMRVLTASAPLAETPAALYSSCDVEATACLAVHKCLLKAQEQGVLAARQMVFDWLVLLTARVAELVGAKRRKADASLADVEALQQLPHILYALLRGPLLQPPAEAMPPPQQGQQQQQQRQAGPAAWRHPDATSALRSLVRQLAPDELAVAVCPQLSSWASPDEAAQMHHSLSAAAFKVSPQPIWVLDAFLQLVILYAGQDASSAGGGGGGDADATPFPPPAASLLRRTVAGIRQVRRCTPEVHMLRRGVDDTSGFDSWLIEDAAGAAAPLLTPAAARQQHQRQEYPTFVAFLSAINRHAQELLR